MKKYIETKEVSATPAWRVDGMVYLKDEAVPQGINKEDGYKVVYEYGGENWIPKEVFEKKYKLAHTYSDRMRIEIDDLRDRLNELRNFILSDEYWSLPLYNRIILSQQRVIMEAYFSILEECIRIED